MPCAPGDPSGPPSAAPAGTVPRPTRSMVVTVRTDVLRDMNGSDARRSPSGEAATLAPPEPPAGVNGTHSDGYRRVRHRRDTSRRSLQPADAGCSELRSPDRSAGGLGED